MDVQKRIEYVATSMSSEYGPYNPFAQVRVNGLFFGNLFRDPISASYMNKDMRRICNMCGFTFCASNGEILSIDLLHSNVDVTIKTLVEMLPPF